MDQNNYNDLIALAPNQQAKNKVKMIANEVFESRNIDIPDPYLGTVTDFEYIYQILDEICTGITKKNYI